MLQPNFLPLITFIFWSWWWTLNGVVSDPQTNLLSQGCSPSNTFVLSNFSIFTDNVNKTFQDIREQILTHSKHFATAQQANAENPVFTLFQCRNYLSIHDCVACFDAAAKDARDCCAGALGGRAIYDGCFLRYDATTAYEQITENFNSVSCGNQTETGSTPLLFTSVVKQVLMNLQTTTPKTQGFFAAMKSQLPDNSNNGGTTTVYAFAQCTETVTQNGCLNCLNAGYINILNCFPNSDGKALAARCFMRYSTTSFFPHDYPTTDITHQLGKQEGSNDKKGTIIGVVVGSVAFVLILLALLLALIIKRPKSPERSLPRGDLSGISKLKGPANFSYGELKLATKSFSAENKLGEGGFGIVYKGILKNGKVVAVKKLRQYKKVEEEFESEVKLIRNVRHRNLIRLLGYCSEDDERILIYEYMKNTSLDKFLFGKCGCSLNWKQRYDIILGIARGLAYLHEEFHIHIIHRDVKTNNILLDEDLQPKIADFGLARFLPDDKSHLSTKMAGIVGYTASAYIIHGQLSEKSDIYSYGVVVLEIISGQRCTEYNLDHADDEGAYLLQKAWKLYEKGKHLELVDKTLHPKEYEEEVKKMIEIGLLCTQAYAELRPSMSEVIVLLQRKGLLENMRPTMPILIETN